MDEQGEGKPTALPVEQDLYGLSFRLYKSNTLSNHASFTYINKSNSCQYNTLARALLIRRSSSSAQPHARSRSNLNQRNHTRFSVAAHERFDQATILPAGQSHRGHLYTTTSDRHGCKPSANDDAIADRMRRRRDRQRTTTGIGRSHRVSRVESGSRLLSLWLFRPLRTAITRSTG